MNILIIGLGNMGSSFAAALQQDAQYTLCAVEPLVARKTQNSTEPSYNFPVYPDIDQASSAIKGDIHCILLAVKPQIVLSVLQELQALLTPSILLISTVAGTSIETINDALKTSNKSPCKIARIMPTIAAKKQESFTALSFANDFNEHEQDRVIQVVSSFGTVLQIPEQQFHAITAMSGSGIAFAASFIEALTLAGVREGLNFEQSYHAALQTIRGALALLEQSDNVYSSPGDLINAVCSPGGTTIEGISALHRTGFHASIFEAVHAASKRSKTLALSQTKDS